MVRHDAKASRSQEQSERIRISLGLLTKEERAAKEQAEQRRIQRAAAESAKGTPLFDE